MVAWPPYLPKRKCQAKKGSLTKKHEQILLELRKDIIFRVPLLTLMLSRSNMVRTMPVLRCHIKVEAIQMELQMANSSIAHRRATASKNIPTTSHTLYTHIGWQRWNFLSCYRQVSHKYKLWLPSYPMFAMSALAMSALHQLWTHFGLWWVIEKPLSCLWLTKSEVSYNQGIWMETWTMTQGRLIKMVHQSVKTSGGINIHIHCHVDLHCCFKFLDIWWGRCEKYADWNMVFFIRIGFRFRFRFRFVLLFTSALIPACMSEPKKSILLCSECVQHSKLKLRQWNP